MKRKERHLFHMFMLALVLLTLSACASPVKNDPVVYVPVPQEDNVEKGKVIQEVKDSVAVVQELINAGECINAERKARNIKEQYRSAGNELETALVTGICLCHLEEDGDIDRFVRCSEELREITADMNLLERETQFVLELAPYFENQRNPNRDFRIDSVIANGIKNTIVSE